jgi:hypothetical protein
MSTQYIKLSDLTPAMQTKFADRAVDAPEPAAIQQKPNTIRIFERNNVPANAPASTPTIFCKAVIECDRDYAKGDLIVTGGNGWRSNGKDGASVANFKVETKESRDARRDTAEAKAGVTSDSVPF